MLSSSFSPNVKIPPSLIVIAVPFVFITFPVWFVFSSIICKLPPFSTVITDFSLLSAVIENPSKFIITSFPSSISFVSSSIFVKIIIFTSPYNPKSSLFSLIISASCIASASVSYLWFNTFAPSSLSIFNLSSLLAGNPIICATSTLLVNVTTICLSSFMSWIFATLFVLLWHARDWQRHSYPDCRKARQGDHRRRCRHSCLPHRSQYHNGTEFLYRIAFRQGRQPFRRRESLPWGSYRHDDL